MSLGTSKMSENALGMVLSLLLLASIIQELRGVELYHHEKLEAVVGQNISLPCIVKSPTDVKIVSIEWHKEKRETTKLVLYSPGHGSHRFWHNVTIQIENNSANELMGSYLQLPEVKKWDEGNYSCHIATFPYGSRQTVTQLIIKEDIKIMCDVNGTVEARDGENVTVRCRSFPNANAKYRWTKNNKLLSENESLELWWVTDADAGVYTLTVNTGNKRLHEEFVVTVLSATTSLKTESPQGLTESAGISLTTSPTSELSKHTDWTTIVTTNIPNATNVTSRAVEHINSFTNSTHITVTASPTTQSYTQGLVSSTASRSLSTVLSSTQETASDEMKKESHTQESHTQQPEGIFSTTPEESSSSGTISKSPGGTPTEGAGDTVPIHLLLVLIIVPTLVLITVAGFLFRRQVIKSRMDLPPPFKPPPPPVKYTAVRHSETLTEVFPISRCNSLTETQI